MKKLKEKRNQTGLDVIDILLNGELNIEKREEVLGTGIDEDTIDFFRIVYLCYFVDLISFRKHGVTMTNYKYRLLFGSPYCKEIIKDTLKIKKSSSSLSSEDLQIVKDVFSDLGYFGYKTLRELTKQTHPVNQIDLKEGNLIKFI